MKQYLNLCKILAMALIFTLSSCEKEDNTGSSASSNPVADSIEPQRAANNQVITVTGKGIGGIESIIFETDSISASFNPNFNTETALIFRIPDDAVPGSQNIIIKNTNGIEFKLPITVLGLPRVQEVSHYSFTNGTEITLSGKNMGDITKAEINGSQVPLEITSKTATSVSVKMITSALNKVKITLTNEAGASQTTQDFINLDKAYSFFTEGFENGWENGSWGPAEVSGTVARSGSKSFKVTYIKGNWSANGFAGWTNGVDYSPEYKSLSFWVKGGPADYTFYITGSQRAIGYGNSDRSYPIMIPANVWTYFKIKLSDLELWKKGTNFKQIGLWIPGPEDQDVTLYLDDFLLLKE